MSPADALIAPVLAAGALCWRVVDGTIRVLVIHRDRHGDVSLPKGKVDPGESLPQTAAREIAEETGLSAPLGAPLGTTEYVLPSGRQKIVYYWTMEIDDDAHESSTFAPSEEVARLEWLPPRQAREALTYPHDREVLDRFQARVDNDTLRTFAIIALRHGKAIAPREFDGPDAGRTLAKEGMRQAQSVAPALAAFGPRKLISSTAVRCLDTIAPTASLTGLPVKVTATISQEAWEAGEADVVATIAKRLARRRTVVLCSHGPVLPHLIEEVARQTNTAPDPAIRASAMLTTGAYTVLHLSRERPSAGIIAIESHGAAR